MSSDGAFPALLEFLKQSRGFDFTGYKQASLERRFRRRMETVGCEDHGAYLDYLEVHPDEYELLFDSLLINVTQFFRDPPVWSHLQAEVLPQILAAKPPDEARAGVERRLRHGPRGHDRRHAARGAPRLGGVRRAREDLRDRHRPARARCGAPGGVLPP